MRNFNKEKQIEIGKAVYTGFISIKQAMDVYNRDMSSIYSYIRRYKDKNNIIIRRRQRKSKSVNKNLNEDFITYTDLNKLYAMSKNDLIMEVLKSRLNPQRLK